MDIKQIRQLIRDGHSVVLVEEGEAPLVVTELRAPPPAHQEIPISRSSQMGQDHVLERLNKEILALKAQIAQEEETAPRN